MQPGSLWCLVFGGQHPLLHHLWKHRSLIASIYWISIINYLLCLYDVYIMSILWLFYVYVMSTSCLHHVNIMPKYVYIMSTLCEYYAEIMSILCLHLVYIMFILCLYHVYIMSIWCLYSQRLISDSVVKCTAAVPWWLRKRFTRYLRHPRAQMVPKPAVVTMSLTQCARSRSTQTAAEVTDELLTVMKTLNHLLRLLRFCLVFPCGCSMFDTEAAWTL